MEEQNNILQKKSTGKYEDLLLNKITIDSMHERYLKQFTFIKSLRDMILLYNESCTEFSNKSPLTNIKLFSNDKYDKSTQGINAIYYDLYSFIFKQKELYEKLAHSLKEIIIYLPKDQKQMQFDKEEKELYNKSKSIMKDFNNMKLNLQKNKNEYYTGLKGLEKHYRDIAENKVEKIKIEQKIKKSIEYTKSLEKKYQDSIKDINKKKEEKINNEKSLFDLYQTSDKTFLNRIKDNIELFIKLIKEINENNIKLMNELIIKFQEIDVNKDIEEYIKDFENVKCEEENFVFEPYIPMAKLPKETLCADEKESEIININYGVIANLKKDFNDICQDINIEEESEKYKLRDVTQKLFSPKVKLSKHGIDKIISWLPNKQYRNYIIVVLSNQRTKGRFERSWRLIYILGQILNKILQISEHEKNYEDVKHCIILSQTFFCSEKKTKNKYFLFEYIKNNKWLKSPKFWDEMTDYMIEKEIESNNKILGQEALDKETLEGKRDRYSQVCISQLLTFSENMIDFGLSKNDINKIMEKKVEKFGITASFKSLIDEHIEKTWKEKMKNKEFVEEDEITHFVKKRQMSMKVIKKRKEFNDAEFDEKNNEIIKNKSIKREKSVKYHMKLKIETNTIIQNIKKEMNLDKINLLKIGNNKSEAVKKINLINNDKDLNINKSYNLNNELKTNEIKKNEIIINDKNEIKEENIKGEPKEENNIVEEEPKEENNIIEEKPKEENQKEEEPKEENNIIEEKPKEENKNEQSEDAPKIEEKKDENKQIEEKKDENKQIEEKKDENKQIEEKKE